MPLTQNEINKIADLVEKYKTQLTPENQKYVFEFIINIAHVIEDERLLESINAYVPPETFEDEKFDVYFEG